MPQTQLFISIGDGTTTTATPQTAETVIENVEEKVSEEAKEICTNGLSCLLLTEVSDRVQGRSGLFAFLVLTGAYVTKSTGKLLRVLDIIFKF